MNVRYVDMALALALGLAFVGCGSKKSRPMSNDGGLDGAPTQLEPGADRRAGQDGVAGDIPAPTQDAAPDQAPDSFDASPDTSGPDASGADGGCGSPTDPRNCGSCGNDCAQLPHVRPDKVGCLAGACVIPPDGCFPGFAHCMGPAINGCETDLTTSGRCGGCDTACPTDARLCATPASGQAMCVADCAAVGLTQCVPASRPFERHCVDLQSHRDHCGGCSARCAIPGAEATCVAGQCVFEKCIANRADCDPALPGCETTVRTFHDCRRCGDSCDAAHATGTCEAAGCKHVCHPGYGNCEASNPDCETVLDTAANCGACGNACPPDRPLCGGSGGQRACVAACAAPTSDPCGTSCTSLVADPLHCGACGVACAGYQICERGRCSPRYVRTDFIADPGSGSPALYVGSISIGPDGSYVIGGSFQGAVDFDPGAGQDIHQSGDSSDSFITRFNADGSYAWTRTWGALLGKPTIGPDGTVVAAGSFQGSVDLDPGPGVDTRQAVVNDPFVLKLAPDGSFVWARTFTGTTDSSSATASAVAVAVDGAVVATGTFYGRVDFDPGPATDIRENVVNPALGSSLNLYVAKLSPAGTFVWVRTIAGQVEPATAAVDAAGAAWVGGSLIGSADFDPGPGVDVRSGGPYNAFVARVSSSGGYLGATTLPNTIYVRIIAFDGDGSAYIGGTTATAFFVGKLSAAGNEQWFKTGPAFDLQAVAAGGGFFVGGSDVRGSLASVGLLVRKHDGNGDAVWTIPVSLPPPGIYPTPVVAADATKLLVVGRVDRGGDFDPGPSRDVISGRGLFITRYAF